MAMRHHQHIFPPPALIQRFPAVRGNGDSLNELSQCNGSVIRLPRGSRVDDNYERVIEFEVDLWFLGKAFAEEGILGNAEGGEVKPICGESGGCH